VEPATTLAVVLASVAAVLGRDADFTVDRVDLAAGADAAAAVDRLVNLTYCIPTFWTRRNIYCRGHST